MEANKDLKKISLNFFGEEISVNIPTSLKSLRQVISEKFMFDPKDAGEIILSYAKGVGKKIIETEKDFVNFVSNHIPKIDLGISEESRIYKESLEVLQNEEAKDKQRLEELIKMKLKNKEKFEAKYNESKIKINAINKQIIELRKKKMKILSELKVCKKENEKVNLDYKKEIIELQKKLNLPVTEKIEPKKYGYKKGVKNIIEKALKKCNKVINKNVKNDLIGGIINFGKEIKNKVQNVLFDKKEEEIHYHFICDGCRCAPIKGIRYHCTECKDFDYCPSCYEKNKDTHRHVFQSFLKSKYPKPVEKLPEQKEKNIHFGVICDGCQCAPIVGIRYKCAVCKNFDYCEKCEEKNRETHNHPFLKINKSNEAPLMMTVVVNENCPNYQN